jgi:hypothetical protein
VVPITLVKSLIEAAASGSSGQLRLGLLEDFVLGLDAQLCSKLDNYRRAATYVDRILKGAISRSQRIWYAIGSQNICLEPSPMQELRQIKLPTTCRTTAHSNPTADGSN